MKKLYKKIILIILVIFIGVAAHAQTWANVGIPGFSAGGVDWTSIAINGSGTPYVVYEDTAYGNKATVMKDSSGTWVTVGLPDFSAGRADYTDIAIDGSGTPYVVYSDSAFGNKGIVMKYDGSSWVTTGGGPFSDSDVLFTSITIGTNDTPYVAYSDVGVGSKATVKKYNGTSWVTVGSAGFSAGEADFTSIAIDMGGTPYVAYEDDGYGDKATVMKYFGGSWVYVGSPGFSRFDVNWTSIAIDGSGTPYVVYVDFYYGASPTVMKYDGSSWVNVGLPGFSPAGGVGYNKWIAIDGCGTPYVAFLDYGHSEYATVMKFDGSSWVYAGSPGFSAGAVTYPAVSMAIDGGGNPYVVYGDGGHGNKATVMKLSLDPIAISGATSLCIGDSVTLTDTPATGIWSSMDTGVASIDSGTGVVTGIAGGNTIISFTEGCQALSLTVTVNPTPYAAPITGKDTICEGDTISFRDTAAGGVWGSSHTSVATVSGSGVVTASSPGTDTITYIVSNPCGADTAYFRFTVRPFSSCPNGVKNINNPPESWSIFPNPATTGLTVTTPGGGYEITDMLGRSLLKGVLAAGDQTVDISTLTPGSYIFTGNKGDTRDYNTVFVKQ